MTHGDSMPDRKGRAIEFIILFLALPLGLFSASRPLSAYFIDVKEGQSTLFVSPSGESMLVDTGWPDHNGRDAGRILSAARDAGIHQVDYLVITHHHQYPVGGVPQLAAIIPVRNCIDHGPSVETSPHAYAESSASFLVDALHPIVAIADNGAHKGGSLEAFRVIHQSPGLEGFSADKELNAPEPYISNMTDTPDRGYSIKLTYLLMTLLNNQ